MSKKQIDRAKDSELLETKTKIKRKRGDRSDAVLLRDADAMHKVMPYIIPKRCDNETFLDQIYDLTKVNEFLEKKNKDNPEFKYTLFHFVCAAVAKTIQLRPKLNNFYSGHRYYHKNDITFCSTVKKTFEDRAAEQLVIIKYNPESDVPPIEQFYSKIKSIVTKVRKTEANTETIDYTANLVKLPRFLLRIAMAVLRFWDYYGITPKRFIADDPYYSSVFIANLGSIGLDCNYHHLANRGSNSIFCVISAKKKRPFFNDDGNFEMKDSVQLSLTIDERIADGVYFAKSLKVIRYFFENPEAVDEPADKLFDIDLTLAHGKRV